MLSVAIGTFDGLHIAHKMLIDIADTVLIIANPNKGAPLNSATVNTFLLGDKPVIRLNFDEIKNLMPAEFFNKYLIKYDRIIVGYNFKFGKNASGGVGDLRRLCNDNGKVLEVVDRVTYKPPEPLTTNDVSEKAKEIEVSSTNIRELITCGNLELANAMLGYDYMISGVVIHGNQIGRTIGFPTANITPAPIMPPFGVYKSKVYVNHICYDGVTNYGPKPTIEKTLDDELLKNGNLNGSSIGKNTEHKNAQIRLNNVVETHILDFDRDIYDQEIVISFNKKIRNIKKFNSIYSLKNQIKLDVDKNFCKKMEISY
ncbi:MAG: hypothetical protein LBM38_03770 [Clostridiales bacterium]|nr:hypothetical protein [Clostridiales bacterium]